MGEFETTVTTVLVPCNCSTVVDWRPNGSAATVDFTLKIKCLYAQRSSSASLCSHTCDIVQHEQRFERCISCKFYERAIEPQLRGIVPWLRHQLPLFNRNHRIRDIMMPWFKHLREQAQPCALYASQGFITMRMQFF